MDEDDFSDFLSQASSFNCDNIDLLFESSGRKSEDFELPRSKKLKTRDINHDNVVDDEDDDYHEECDDDDDDDDRWSNNVLDKILCTFKDPIHILKDPIRLPCSSRYICKECMWMSNPNDKTFKCRFCKKKHLKGKIMTTSAKNKIDNYVNNNLNLIIEKFLSQIRTRIDEINERWRNYKEIVDIKEQYFNDELDITIESINIRYDMFKDDMLKEFNEKLASIKKDVELIINQYQQKLGSTQEFVDEDITNLDLNSYMKNVEAHYKQLETLEENIDCKLNEIDLDVSDKLPTDSIVGTFRVGSLNFNSKFQNIQRMNKIVFVENSKASYGEIVDIDSESNIIILCPRTFSLVKTNFDASKLLKCISLEEFLADITTTEQPPPSTSDETATTTSKPFSIEDFDDFLNDSDSSNDEDTWHTQKECKKPKPIDNLISMCVSNNTQEIYVLADHKNMSSFEIMCFDLKFNFIRKFKIDNLTEFFVHFHEIMGYRRNRKISRNLKLKLSCYTNELKETKLYVSTNSGVFVYTQLGLLLGQLDLGSNENYSMQNFTKIIATKTFTYILCGQRSFMGRSIIVFETNIDNMGIRKLGEKPLKDKQEQFNRKIIDCSAYKCKSIQTFYGDDFGNIIFIGKSENDQFMYLFYLNYEGQLMYRTKLFNKIILDITVDNVTSRNYRLIASVKNNRKSKSNELMWIYEFENDFAENIEKKINFQKFPIQH